MDKFSAIRPVVLGLAVRDGKTLVSEGYNSSTNTTFYRSLGGGVEFFETLEEALKREFKEELSIGIKIKEYLGFIDNMFNYNGKDAHEHVFIYSIDLDEYKEEYVLQEGDIKTKAIWIDITDIKNGSKKLYPTDIIKYLQKE